jgi:transposase
VCMDSFLSKSERQSLYAELGLEREVRYSDRIRTILLLDQGKSYEEIAEFLFINRRTAERYKKSYSEGGIESLLNIKFSGGLGYLNVEEQEELKVDLSSKVYRTLKEIQSYISKNYKVHYSLRGLGLFLKKLGFVYKKPVLIPGKANRESQEKFAEELEELKSSVDPLYFADGVHPQHNTHVAHGWILKGENFELKSNTKRFRVCINGALNAEDPEDIVIDSSATINAQSTIRLLKKIEEKNPAASNINVVVDNARYYRCKLVKEYLVNSKITLVFLPPYSPNLNLIERLWKVMYREILYNIYFENFADFRKAIMSFFRKRKKHREEIQNILNFKFQIIGV